MATKKTTTKSIQKSRLLKAAETVGTIAGTIVGKKNQLIKKAGRVIEKTKAKVHALTSKKEAIKKAAKKDVKSAVKKVTRKVSEVKKAAKKDTKIVVQKATRKVSEVKKVTKEAAASTKARVEKAN